jgi:tRNA-splicing ligase RtcB
VQKFFLNLPDVELAYFSEHTEHFDDYVEAVEWAQDYARRNRDLMMEHRLSGRSGLRVKCRRSPRS